MAATQQGVVIAASPLGKLKTIMQVAAVMILIAVPGHPVWVSLLVYVTVAITVFSGADYFFGLRRRITELERRRADRAGA
jgi:CDP-diacylglycerol--glycerol-3-phosphate 3-phosphatidyltransferase